MNPLTVPITLAIPTLQFLHRGCRTFNGPSPILFPFVDTREVMHLGVKRDRHAACFHFFRLLFLGFEAFADAQPLVDL